MAHRDNQVPQWNWIVYPNSDARFEFEVGTEDDEGVFTLDPDADDNEYTLTIKSPPSVHDSYSSARYESASISAALPVEDSRVAVHLDQDTTAQMSPHKKYTYRIDEQVPSGDRNPILMGDLFVRAGA